MTLETSTATVERSFSSLRRLKPYLRTTVSTDARRSSHSLHNIRSLITTMEFINDLVIKFAQVQTTPK